jgi:hypothetical protein
MLIEPVKNVDPLIKIELVLIDKGVELPKPSVIGVIVEDIAVLPLVLRSP